MRDILIVLGCVVAMAAAQRRPPNYSQDFMPDTSFNCRDKVVGGYYADQETDCQMFHVCVKVPGIGVQDYRFLCPNDTTFDQENQICANWYDIDCEASTLFYSDNFDLYKVDKGGSQKVVTPFALGPSSTQRPVVVKPRPVDDEEEFYLQRSETGDRRLQKDLLRGSSSGNFFNKNKGKDDEDDFADDEYKPVKKPVPRPQAGQKKVAVRKQVRKRPQEAQQFDTNARQSYESTTTSVPIVSTTTERYVNRQNNRFRGQSHRTADTGFNNSPSTASPTTFNNNNNNNNNPTTFRPIASSSSSYNPSPSTYNPSTFKANPSTVNPSTYNPSSFNPSTYNPSTFNPSTAAPTSRGTQYQPRYNTVNRNTASVAASTTTTTTTVAPSFKSRNNRPRYDSRTPVNVKPTTRFEEYSSTQAPTTRNYFSQPASQQDNSPRGFEVKASFPTTTFAPVVTYNGNYKARTASTKTSEYQDYSGSYDSYGNQRDTSDEYVEVVKNDEEFLKTAPSNNIRPSNFNNFAKASTQFSNKDVTDFTKATSNFKQAQTDFTKTTNYNNQEVTKSANNFKQAQTDFTKVTNNYKQEVTNRPTSNYRDVSPSDFTRAPQNFNRPSSTQNNNQAGSDFTKAPQNNRPQFQNSPSTTQYYAPSTTPKSVSEKKSTLATKLTNTKLKDASYDYAYYDDTEYEGADPISDHHFGKAGESQKISG